MREVREARKVDATGILPVLCSDLLRRGHTVRFAARGGSMHPTIRDGEAITVEPVAVDGVRWGDIVLCRQGPGLVAHRVVRKVGRGCAPAGFVLRGDASHRFHHEVGAGDVLGRVVAVRRKGTAVPLGDTAAKLMAALEHGVKALRRSLAGEGVCLFIASLRKRRMGK